MLLLFALVAFASDAASPDKPQVLAKGTRQLTTEEIRKKLVGADLQKVMLPELYWLDPPDTFRKDGTFTQYEHRDERAGTYSIRDNRLCTTLRGEQEKCQYLWVDTRGRYWISPSTRTFEFNEIEFLANSGESLVDPNDPYAGRDGAAEARADIRRGRRLKLYYSWMWGEALRLPTVGIDGCWEDRPEDMAAAKGIFVTLPQLTFAEDGRYHPDEMIGRESARTFARAYNLTMWRHKKTEILRLCPEASAPD